MPVLSGVATTSEGSVQHVHDYLVSRMRYLTGVLDLVTAAVVFVAKGRSAGSLAAFWRRLHPSGAKIRAVAIDMSPAYIEAVRRNLRKAKIVFDRFHVVKLFNDKLSDLRRQVQSGAEGEARKVLKCTRWLLLRNPENLGPRSSRPSFLRP